METVVFDNKILEIWYESWFVAVAFVASVATLGLSIFTTFRLKAFRIFGGIFEKWLHAFLGVGLLATLPLILQRSGVTVISEGEPLDSVALVNAIASIFVVSLSMGNYYFLNWYMKRGEDEEDEESVEEIDVADSSATDDEELVVSPLTSEVDIEVPAAVAATGTGTLSPTSDRSAAYNDLPDDAVLTVTAGNMSGQTIDIDDDRLSLGRSADNDIVIDDQNVSRSHAELSYSDGAFYIEDKGSSTGTFVGNDKISSVTKVQSGVSITLGTTAMTLGYTSDEEEDKGSVEATLSPPVADAGATVVMTPPEPAPPSSAGATMIMPSAPQVTSGLLTVTSGDSTGDTYQIKMGVNSIGRGDDNDFVLKDGTVSRVHAIIRADNNGFIISDLGSTSGTTVGNIKLGSETLETGSTIQVGNTTFNYVSVDDAGTQDAPATSASATMVYQAPSKSGLLIVQSGPDAGKTFSLNEGDNTIGTEGSSSVAVTDNTVGSNHAIVRVFPDGAQVIDNASPSGTTVNGKKLASHSLSTGDNISMGTAIISFTS